MLHEFKIYKEIGEFFCHPSAVRLEHFQKETKIWFYFRSSSNSRSLGYYVLKNQKISKSKTIEINPGDSGTELGREIYKTIFTKDNLISSKIIKKKP